MTLLVDAYNALHVTGVLPPALAGPSVDDLARYIALSRWARRGAILVCDGGPQRRPTSSWPVEGVEIRYAGAGRDADSLIVELVRASDAPRRLLVVSSDRAVRQAARKRKAKTLTSEAFLERLVEDVRRASGAGRGAAPKPQAPLPPAAVDAWLDDLGLAGDPILALTPSAEPRAGASDPEQRTCAPASSSDDQADSALPPVDPLLLEALQEWPDRLRLSDLDMARWLPDADTPAESLRPAVEEEAKPQRSRRRR